MGLYELWTHFRLGGPIGDYTGVWEGPIKGYTTNLVQGSYRGLCRVLIIGLMKGIPYSTCAHLVGSPLWACIKV